MIITITVMFLHLPVLKLVVLYLNFSFLVYISYLWTRIYEMNGRDGLRVWFSYEEIKRKILGFITGRKRRRCRARQPIVVYFQSVRLKIVFGFLVAGLTCVVLRSPDSRVVVIFSVFPGTGWEHDTQGPGARGIIKFRSTVFPLPFGPRELTHVKRCTCRVPPRAH